MGAANSSRPAVAPRGFGCVFATLTECFRCDALPHWRGSGVRRRPGTVMVACYHGRRRIHHIGPLARGRPGRQARAGPCNEAGGAPAPFRHARHGFRSPGALSAACPTVEARSPGVRRETCVRARISA
ncbi:hypothetical protein A33K_13336 [Burkholderia humptydooensis MSMB43]|uniref:Uncharacterized protein n=1 Tax=Burkholderia humptydooensis MSMB43 TaxID=441157 RepID=A0ABN0GCG5_9BURK|nr:hypothetical protein A33K_13336 [Burkholderia humptydooensis MSMB43]